MASTPHWIRATVIVATLGLASLFAPGHASTGPEPRLARAETAEPAGHRGRRRGQPLRQRHEAASHPQALGDRRAACPVRREGERPGTTHRPGRAWLLTRRATSTWPTRATIASTRLSPTEPRSRSGARRGAARGQSDAAATSRSTATRQRRRRRHGEQSRAKAVRALATRWRSGGKSGQEPRRVLLAGRAVDVDSEGNVYVADSLNSRVQKLSPNGKPLAQRTNAGGSNLGMVSAVRVDHGGNIRGDPLLEVQDLQAQPGRRAARELRWRGHGSGPSSGDRQILPSTPRATASACCRRE